MEKTYLIEKFVHSYKGMALIRDIAKDSIVLSNSLFRTFSHNADSFEMAINMADNAEKSSGFVFYDYVEFEFKKSKKPTFSLEIFDGRCYISIRFIISYKKRPSILTLISENTSIEGLGCFNDIYSCHEVFY